jgi:hypothetical protein
VVIGAPNTAFFAPDTGPFPYESFSFIHTNDYDLVKNIAELMLDLEANPSVYQEMLQYKTVGYSDDYKVLADLTDIHSRCRICTFAGDSLRRTVYV